MLVTLQKFTIDSFKSLNTLFELGLLVEVLNTCEFESGFGLVIVETGSQDLGFYNAKMILRQYSLTAEDEFPDFDIG